MKRSLAFVLSLSFASTLASSALADGDAPAPDQKAAAQVLFDSGRELVMQQKFAEACPKFAQSLKLDPGLGTMLWLADCYENNGQTASAWAQFKEAAGVAALQKDPREAVARRRVTVLDGKLSKLVVALAAGGQMTGVEIRRDGVPVAPTEIGLPIPVDPGIHAVAASAPGYKTWTANIDVPSAAPAPVVVNVPVLEADSVASASASATRAVPEPSPSDPDTTTSGSTWTAPRIAGVTIAAVGLVGIGIGSVLGLSAKSAYDDSNNDGHCLPDNRCDDVGKQRRSDASGLATGSTIAFVAGGAALVGGAVLFFVAPSLKKTGMTVAPMVGQRDAGVVLGRSF